MLVDRATQFTPSKEERGFLANSSATEVLRSHQIKDGVWVSRRRVADVICVPGERHHRPLAVVVRADKLAKGKRWTITIRTENTRVQSEDL
ncbi:hypothetical protein BaRGS_00025864 [Batillaria attramentaria]|uniref:Uncharacterized protein n=1 Tax=Batillaria attramentaria TaxID=370345 RepID=A0ABD0K776_9CAEN